MIHQLKINTKYFEDVISGQKTFEIRKNDRDFKVGDFLGLNEVADEIPFGEVKETGRCALFIITYILTDLAYMREGYVGLGIAPCDIHQIKPGNPSNVYTRQG